MTELLAYLVSEYRQDDMPDVPLPADVDVSELTAGDDSPMFVTLPILKVGGKSANGFTWQEPDVDRVVSEINTKRPEGNAGHIKPEDRAHKYEFGKVRWISSVRIGETAYAKAYVPKYAQDAREYFRVAKATRARVGTSVYGRRGPKGLRDMVVESLDFGHPDRLGFEGAAVVPHLTSEFEGSKGMGEEKGQDELIAELKNDRATLNLVVSELKLDAKDPLTAAKSLVSEIANLRRDKETLDTLVSEMGLDAEKPVASAKAIVSELAAHRQRMLVQDVDDLIAEMFKESPEALHQVVREFLVEVGEDGRERANIASRDEAKARLEALKEKDTIKSLAKALVSEQRGPRAFVRGKDKDSGGHQLDTSPEAVAKDRAWLGT